MTATLHVKIVRARGLHNADAQRKLNPYCVARVSGRGDAAFKTFVAIDELNPVWDHGIDIADYRSGDVLEFSVFDKKPRPQDDVPLGRTMLTSFDFWPNGCHVDLPLTDDGSSNATLEVEVECHQSTPSDKVVRNLDSTGFLDFGGNTSGARAEESASRRSEQGGFESLSSHRGDDGVDDGAAGGADMGFRLGLRSEHRDWRQSVPTKRALLIGINYIGTDNELGGCINDALNERDVLTRHFGFSEGNVLLLTDEKGSKATPTKKEILEGLAWLTTGIIPGDTLFFSYSGHGTQVPDASREEADGLNEAICPVDCMDEPWPARLITDDDLHAFWQDLPDGVHLTCVFDCCHSGTMGDLPVSRDLGATGAWHAKPPQGARSRFLRPPSDMHEKLMGRSKRRAIGGQLTRPSVRNKHLWIFSGCQDSQTSADATIGGTCQGALTWSLLKALAEAHYNVTCDDLLAAAKRHLEASGYAQVPALSTTSEELLTCRYLRSNLPLPIAEDDASVADSGAPPTSLSQQQPTGTAFPFPTQALSPQGPLTGSLMILFHSGYRLREAGGWLSPYCSCEVVGRPLTRIQTKTLSYVKEPVWNQELELRGFTVGDTLEFSVWDRGVSGEERLGCALLETNDFYPEGCHGDLSLVGGTDPSHDATLTIQLIVPPELGGSAVINNTPMAALPLDDLLLPSNLCSPPASRRSHATAGQTARVEVVIASAKGLRDATSHGFVSAEPYCIMQVMHRRSQPVTARTSSVGNSTDPIWNHRFEFDYLPGESLQFTVLDKDRPLAVRDNLLGTLTLDAAEFYPSGVSGDFTLKDAGIGVFASLRVSITVLALPQTTAATECEALPPPGGPNLEMPNASPKRLEVLIVRAANLQEWDDPEYGHACPYCICEVPRRPETKVQTRVIEASSQPAWNERFGLDYMPGESLQFTVLDQQGTRWQRGQSTSRPMGKVTLASDAFFPSGWGGELRIRDDGAASDATLVVRICVIESGREARNSAVSIGGASYSSAIDLGVPVPLRLDSATSSPKSRHRAALEVFIVSASGLQSVCENGVQQPRVGRTRMVDPFCVCEVFGKPHLSAQTPALRHTSHPTWNHRCHLECSPGDSLLFRVWDQECWPRQAEMLGAVTLHEGDFYPLGAQGEYQLLGENNEDTGATLTVCISVNRLPESRMSLAGFEGNSFKTLTLPPTPPLPLLHDSKHRSVPPLHGSVQPATSTSAATRHSPKASWSAAAAAGYSSRMPPRGDTTVPIQVYTLRQAIGRASEAVNRRPLSICGLGGGVSGLSGLEGRTVSSRHAVMSRVNLAA
eukprot:TRINITY_DN9037_c1_g2_i2.p1 TRINITY_DN9037_c1_g2~~TRINITY_DN9037_c1_g2_i2.p1  ORF type:complete len:1305 (-),score=185.27 TRINITY_DN9037_c1_g2_i2:67-3981(-)